MSKSLMSSGTVKPGAVYNWLTVKRIYVTRGKTHFDATCRCGNNCTVIARYVVLGKVKSCGCYRKTSEAYTATRRRKGFGYSSFVNLYNSYRSNAKRRGLDFDLTKDEFHAVTQRPCSYCGQEPKQEHRLTKSAHGFYTYSGIDRIDNATGYVAENSVPCCGQCNKAKGTMSETEFLAWVSKVSKFRSS